MICLRTILCFLISAGWVGQWAQADELPTPPDGPTFGLAYQMLPRYSGSDQSTWSLMPVVQYTHEHFMVDSSRGVGYHLQADSGLYVEPTFGLNLGRSDQDAFWRDGSNRLHGMGDIPASLTSQLALGMEVAPWLTLEGLAIMPTTSDQGVAYQPSATGSFMLGKTEAFSLKSTLLFGNNRYNNTWYGVSDMQSAQSALARYTAPSGYYGHRFQLDWYHLGSLPWSTDTGFGYTRLADRIGDSPLVLRGNNFDMTVAVTYTF